MYSVFRLIFLVFVINSVQVKHQFQDNHPFVTNNNVDARMFGTNSGKFMLIPSIGYEKNNDPGKFTCILNGWYYEPLNPTHSKYLIQSTIKLVLNLFGDTEAYNKEEQQERLGAFFVSDVKNHKIELKLSDSISEIVSTDDNGRFYEKIIINSLQGLQIKDQILTYIASDNDNHKQQYKGIIYLMKNKKHIGCSIISDIDDTIKISDVPNKKNLMINTFKKDFKAVPGMSDVYNSWKTSYKCLIHYVSAMPSQLYYVTQKFLNKEKFPGGSFHMRHLKLVSANKFDLVGKFIDFIEHDASRKHKITVIEDILNRAPQTQEFIMVGDSGELDPEIYGQIARKYSDRIKMIFIRLVSGGNNNNTRFESAFNNVSSDKWNLFSDANELPKILYNDTDLIDTDDEDKDSDSDSLNSAIITSTSSFFNTIPILVLVLYKMAYI